MPNCKEILNVSNLCVRFKIDYFKKNTLRDLFISLVNNPMSLIFHETKFYEALKNVSFSINKGDRVGLVGINGSGKTTLCRCLCEMLSLSSGEISLQGYVRGIFNTSIGIHPELTGRENLELMSFFFYPAISSVDRFNLVNEVVKFTELGEFIDTPFMHYSRGMQVRLFLTLSSALPEDLLILDEVFDGADKFFKEKIEKRFLNMIDNSGALLFVSHDIDQIKKICNRLIVLKEGKIIFDGDVAEGENVFNSLA